MVFGARELRLFRDCARILDDHTPEAGRCASCGARYPCRVRQFACHVAAQLFAASHWDFLGAAVGRPPRGYATRAAELTAPLGIAAVGVSPVFADPRVPAQATDSPALPPSVRPEPPSPTGPPVPPEPVLPESVLAEPRVPESRRPEATGSRGADVEVTGPTVQLRRAS